MADFNSGLAVPARHAGFGLRLGAYLIDTVLIYIVSFLLGLIHESMVYVVSVATIIYFPVAEASSWQGTLGKKLLGLKVVAEEGGRIGLGRSFGRFFSRILSSILFIGYIMIAFTENKQGLHDKIVSTFVVKA